MRQTTTPPAPTITALVPRYVDLVYATARRLVGDGHTAEDVTQATFIALLRKADRVDPRHLPGWLVNAARLAAREALRSQGRRRSHESRAAQLRTETTDDPADEPTTAHVLPLLDEALSHLSEADRTAVVLRFLQGLSFAEVGSATGATEEAARKRVGRALEKLRHSLVKQGVTPSMGGLAVVLASQQAPPAPPTAVAAATATPSPAVSSIAGQVVRALQWSRATTVATIIGISVGGFVATGAVVVTVQFLTGGPPPKPHVAASRPSPHVLQLGLSPQQRDELKAQLDRDYALKPDEVIRLIEPPFSATRDGWAMAEFPYAKAAKNIRSLGFQVATGQGMAWSYMSYGDEDLASIVIEGLREPWYSVDGLDAVQWTDVQGDFVVRTDAPVERKFAALADLMTQRTGVRVRFVPHTADRPCIVLHGPTGKGPDNGSHFATVVLSRKPLTREQIIARGNRRPFGWTHAFQFDAACKNMDAPFFLDPSTGHGSFHNNDLFPVAADAMLHRTDPGYETALRQVLDNVQAQIGGDFAIERRPIRTFTLERVR
jgi:RNA polymerase sigma factor (sigma-70 family)